jgi:hypothetical protein
VVRRGHQGAARTGTWRAICGTIGVGQHKRKNDALDAEHIAIAVDQGRIPEAHVLSPERREQRKKLSIRQALVETRSQYIVTIRGLARAQFGPPSARTSRWRLAHKKQSVESGRLLGRTLFHLLFARA